MSQVAYDRFVLELPSADSQWRPLADPEVVAETAAWLWDFGPTPLVAVVGHDGVAPSWLATFAPRTVAWAPDGAVSGAAILLATRADLERFLGPARRTSTPRSFGHGRMRRRRSRPSPPAGRNGSARSTDTPGSAVPARCSKSCRSRRRRTAT